MQYEPKDYQRISEQFLTDHHKCALFLDMGLGKTVVTLTRIKALVMAGEVKKALVIAPLRVAQDTWSREADKWDHLRGLRVVKVLGSAEHRSEVMAFSDAEVYVINRENVMWLVEKYGKCWPFDMVVIDELSSFKSAKSKRWRALRRVIGLSEYVVGLTGTPAPNGYLDLWPEIYLLDKGERLGKNLGDYRTTYFTPGAHNGKIVYQWKMRRGAKQRIDDKLSDLCLSMSKEDWLKLPPVIYNTVTVQMDSKERKAYDRMMMDSVLPILDGKVSELEDRSSAIVGATAATLSNKLLQMANGSVYDDNGDIFHLHDRKLEALDDIIEEAHGQPVLVFYSYRHDLTRLRERYKDGKTLGPEVDTQQMISAWNAGEIPVLFCHPAAAGHGLNLQEGGHIIVWFGLPWSLELYQQANARLYRQGQTESVIIHHVVCEDTVDERVLQALSSKNATQKSLLDALKGYLT